MLSTLRSHRHLYIHCTASHWYPTTEHSSDTIDLKALHQKQSSQILGAPRLEATAESAISSSVDHARVAVPNPESVLEHGQKVPSEAGVASESSISTVGTFGYRRKCGICDRKCPRPKWENLPLDGSELLSSFPDSPVNSLAFGSVSHLIETLTT